MLNEKRFGGDDESKPESYLKRSREESTLLGLLRCKADDWPLLKSYEALVEHMKRLESHDPGFDLYVEEMDIVHHSRWKMVYVGKAIGLSCTKMH